MKTDTFMRVLLLMVVAFSIIGLVMAYEFNKTLKESQVYKERLKERATACENGHPLDESVSVAFCKCIHQSQSEAVCQIFLE